MLLKKVNEGRKLKKRTRPNTLDDVCQFYSNSNYIQHPNLRHSISLKIISPLMPSLTLFCLSLYENLRMKTCVREQGGSIHTRPCSGWRCTFNPLFPYINPPIRLAHRSNPLKKPFTILFKGYLYCIYIYNYKNASGLG